jgi:hypothetical protein
LFTGVGKKQPTHQHTKSSEHKMLTTGAPFLVLAALVGGGVSPPLSTLALKQCLADAQARIWAWEIEYESARTDDSGSPAERYVHRIVAAKAPDRFFHWSAHGTPWLDWRDDLYQQRLTVAARRIVSERPLDRLFIEKAVRPDEPLPGTAPNEFLLVALGWWPLAERPSPVLVDTLSAALSAVARSPRYEARRHREHVCGRWCHVLECPGRDQLWLDVDRGCALIARQITYDRPAQIHRVELADFRELVPGIWAPFTLRNLHYARNADGTKGRMLLDAKLSVLQIRLNEAVDDARFRFQPLPGSVGQIVGETPMRQVVAGGEDYLDEVVEWIPRYQPHLGVQTARSSWANWSDMASGAVFAVLIITLGRWCLSHRRGHP